MRIAFVCHPDITLASFRFRVWMVGDALRDLGHDIYVVDLYDHPEREDMNQFDVVVYSKHQRPEVQAKLFERTRLALKIFDCCDDHLNDWQSPAIMAHYLKMCRGADLVLTSTQVLADRIKAATQRDAVVIPEPLEYDQPRVPKAPKQIRRLFWHGHRSNLDGLMEVIDQLRDWKLHVCTNIKDDDDGEILLRHLSQHHPDAVLASWSPQEIGKGHAACDLVIVPVAGGRDSHKAYKGFQRGVEALMLGRMALCTDIPAYDGWPVLTTDNSMFRDAIEAAGEDPQVNGRLERMIRDGQQRALKELSRPEIGRRWVEAIEGAFERAAA